MVLYDDLILKDEEVKVPRDEITKYAFVLLPLAEIAPDIKHPLTKQRLADLAQAFDNKGQSLWQVEVSVISHQNEK